MNEDRSIYWPSTNPIRNFSVNQEMRTHPPFPAINTEPAKLIDYIRRAVSTVTVFSAALFYSFYLYR